jgi:hypothetical protein
VPQGTILRVAHLEGFELDLAGKGMEQTNWHVLQDQTAW